MLNSIVKGAVPEMMSPGPAFGVVLKTGFGGWFAPGEGDGEGTPGPGVGAGAGPVTLTRSSTAAAWPPALTEKVAVYPPGAW